MTWWLILTPRACAFGTFVFSKKTVSMPSIINVLWQLAKYNSLFNGLKNATSLFKTYITFSTPPNCYTVIRNPDEDEIGPWCYTIIDGLVEMEHCTIELCPGKYLMSSRISILVDIQQFQLLSCINWIIILFAILNEQHNYRSNSKGLANRKASSSFLSSHNEPFAAILIFQ